MKTKFIYLFSALLLVFSCAKEKQTSPATNTTTVKELTYTLLPKNNDINVSFTEKLIISFDEIVNFGSGNITIYQSAESIDKTIYETIPVSSGQVTGNGTKTVSITPTKSFRKDKNYYVKISKGAFGEKFKGMLNQHDWHFSTGDLIEEIYYSKSVKDEYKIYITRPANYETNTTQSFEVYYCLDAFRDLAINNQAFFPSQVPDAQLIQVSIEYPGGHIGTYPNITTVWDSIHRERDYLFPHGATSKESGGAPAFLEFFHKELIPYINNNFRTKSEIGPIFFGHSYGGFFSLYALCNNFTNGKNPYFKSFIASSPAVNWSDYYIMGEIDKLKNINFTNDIRLYFSFGSAEITDAAGLKWFNDWGGKMQDSVSTHLLVKYEVNEGLDHATNSGVSPIHGLEFIFKK